MAALFGDTRSALAGACAAVLVVVVLLLVHRWWRARGESFGDPGVRVQAQKVIDALTGVEYDRVRDTIPVEVIEEAQSKADFLRLTPEEVAERAAARADAAAAPRGGGRAGCVYEPYVAGGDVAAEVEQCHAQRPVDYGEVALAAVADSSMLARQRAWCDGMAAFSGAAGIRNLDPIDVTASLPRQGLTGFNPSPVVQTNALQLTEVDAEDLAKNPRTAFSF